MRIIERIKTLWFLSGIDLQLPENRESLINTIQRVVNRKRAIIVGDDPIEKAFK